MTQSSGNNKTGVIIGLAIGCSVLAIGLIGACFAAWRRRQRQHQPLVPYGGGKISRPQGPQPSAYGNEAGFNYSYNYENGYYGNGSGNGNAYAGATDYNASRGMPDTSTYGDHDPAMSQVGTDMPSSPPRIARAPSPTSVYTLPPHPLAQQSRPAELAPNDAPGQRASSHMEGTRWA